MIENILVPFTSVALLVALSPGQTNLYVLSQGLSGKKDRVWVAVAGIIIGNLIWVLLCALGIAAIIKSSYLAFEIIKTLGALYLLYLGFKVFRQKSPQAEKKYEQISVKMAPLRGALSSLSNPKGFIFYLSFLPQFIEPGGSYFIQIVLLGTLYIGLFIPITLGYGFLGHRLLPLLKKDIYVIWLNRLIGGFLMAMGLSLFWYKKE
jgi:homoserine/homoserine lactone efflux protein